MKKILIWLLLAELFPAVILILLLLTNLGIFSTETLKALILIVSVVYIATVEIAVLIRISQKPKKIKLRPKVELIEAPKPICLLDLVFEPNFGGKK